MGLVPKGVGEALCIHFPIGLLCHDQRFYQREEHHASGLRGGYRGSDFFACADIVSAAGLNPSKVSAVQTPDDFSTVRVLDLDTGSVKHRFLRGEGTDESDDEEERALPSAITKLTDKLKPVADKLKPLANKLTPVAEKLTDKTMAVAVRLKPIADTFSGKLKPIADKLIPIFKPLGAKLNAVPVIQKVQKKLKEFAQKIQNMKVGEATIGQRYTMAKFEYWFKLNKSPDDVKAMLKVGTGATVNTKNYDLWNQYSVFYKIAQREKDIKLPRERRMPR